MGGAQRKKSRAYSHCGTQDYIAPEILSGRGYNVEVDMWSAGVVLYVMLCAFPPDFDDSGADGAGAVPEFPSPYWDHVSGAAKDLIRQLLVIDPARRLSAAGALKHPWFSEQPRPFSVGADGRVRGGLAPDADAEPNTPLPRGSEDSDL